MDSTFLSSNQVSM